MATTTKTTTKHFVAMSLPAASCCPVPALNQHMEMAAVTTTQRTFCCNVRDENLERQFVQTTSAQLILAIADVSEAG
jgi:hypothetical protein